MAYEYKCVGAPERPRRQRGVRGRSDRVALAMQELINAEAVGGWEYLRTDSVPVEEKAGLFSHMREVNRAVLIFRREIGAAHAPAARAEAPATGEAPPWRAAEPRAEPRAEARDRRNGDERIPLAADRAEPVPPARRHRPPSGLG